MKLRNKLAAVLATAMVITSVPVVTMANTTNKVTQIKENDKFTDAATAPSLSIKFTNFKGTEDKPEVFYITLTNATWNVDALNAWAVDEETEASESATASATPTSVTFTTQDSNKTLKVALYEDTLIKNNILTLPCLMNVKTGDVKATLDTSGSGSTAKLESTTIATTSDEIATVSVGTAKTFNKEGVIADITFTEAYKGSMDSLLLFL